ncbi:hypothetical protein DPB93_24390 [Salmonella enterica subsp. salamae]|nr:filamentous hemagglutinin N-terminal domain-containing protein [Salmonella enterica subsp. salamae]ECI4078696.1 hypothetical protein [Salmonella enterica subsp. salamae]EEO2383759.1 filamentous hemagglutinin N-terminal domain-containing protein [Salmonella enterica]
MNRIYRLKFDKRRNELVVVSEITAGMGKEKSTGHIADLPALSSFRTLPGALTPLALLTGLVFGLLPAMVLAAELPTGGQVVGGQGSITTSGNQMTIHQQTQNMATDWHSFDIGKNSTVQFVQPDSRSVALNRVTGASGSRIMGTLNANGKVFLINPNGVLFGKGASVNTAGLVASTRNISTADFMRGNYALSGGGSGAEIINQGSLTTTKGGFIVLAADRVSNRGTLTTPSGRTVLAAADTITLQLDNGGLTSVRVNGSVVNALAENRGLISATNGQVFLTAQGRDMLLNTVVNNSGTIEAGGLESRGGEIVLSGGDSGVVSQSGRLLADSRGGRGGKITLEGQNIHLAGNSLTSATGSTGGGEVYVGGGWQGKDSRIRNASKVVMDKNATIDVSAARTGNGGTAVLWSDDYTNFRGTILAKGGARSGNGGRVETSSHRNLQSYGSVDASARAGHGGEWLLDPTDVTIVGTGADTGTVSATADGSNIFTPTADGAKILNTSIESQLNAGTNVTVKTSGTDTDGQSGNITVSANITKSAGADAKLTLLADNNIVTSEFIKIGATTGKLNLDMLAGNTTQNATVILGREINISLNGGDFLAGAANTDNRVALTYQNSGQIYGGNVTLNVSGGLGGYAYAVRAGNDLNINGPVSGSTGWGIPLTFTAGGMLTINSPTGISLKATDPTNSGGRVVINGDKGVRLNAAAGGVVLQAVSAATNGVNITSANGSVSISGLVKDGSDVLTLTNVNISSKNDTMLNGTTYWGNAVTLSGLNITAGGNVDIVGVARNVVSGKAGGASASGVRLSGSNISSQKGNITVSGFAGTDQSHQNIVTVNISNSTLTSPTGKIVLNGTSESTTGLNVVGSNLSATQLDIKGVATSKGTGFALANSHLLGGLADLTKVSFSSAGSAAGVTNRLDNSIVTGDNRDAMLKKHIENMTSIDMSGMPVFDDSEKTDKGWTADYSAADMPDGGWIFNNTCVTAHGDVNLKGVGFTNATLTVDSGNLSIDNGARTLTLNGTNVSAGGNITLTANGGISYVGSNSANHLTMTAGGSLSANASAGTVKIQNADLISTSGNIDVYGNGATGVELTDITMRATAGNITVFGKGTKVSAAYDQRGAITLSGNSTFNAINTSIHGVNTGNIDMSGYSPAGIFIGDNQSFSGGSASVLGYSPNGVGVQWSFKDNGGITQNVINISAASFTLEGRSEAQQKPQYNTAGGIGFGNFINAPVHVIFNLSNRADVHIIGNATTSSQGGLSLDTDVTRLNKYIFNGSGSVDIVGKSGSGQGLMLRGFDNSGLNGSMSITGESVSGTGVIFDRALDVKLTNATVTGTSRSGTGIAMAASKGQATLSNVTLSGQTDTGESAVTIAGTNISLNGTLNGTVTQGTGAGVVLNGTGNFTVSGAAVNGTAVDGTGVVVNGTVNVTDGGTLTGSATGAGNGVDIQGTLTGATVHGKSGQGAGLQLADNAVLTGASLKGESFSGSGVAVTGNISLDDVTATGLDASSVNGNGLSLENNAHVSVVNGTTKNPVTTPVILTGTSQNGSGVATSGNVSISGVVLNGSATTARGAGATLGGNLTIADNISGITVNATGNGTALVVDNASIRADGYTGSGQDFVINASTSDSGGTAIKTQGNNQLNNITLSGTAANGGTAVQVGGQVSGGHISGTSDTGNAVEVQDGVHADGVDIKGHSDNGTGLNMTGNTTLSNTILNGTSQTGTGAVVSGAITADEQSGLRGEATAAGGTGVRVSGTVAGGTVAGISTTGNAVHLTDGAQINDAVVLGTSQDGVGIRSEGQVNAIGSQLRGDSLNGTDMVVSGMLSHDAGTKIDAETVIGQENIHEVKPVLPPVTDGGDEPSGDKPSEDKPSGEIPSENDQNPGNAASLLKQAEITSVRQGGASAQVTRMNQPERDGFHSAATPPVPVKEYRPSEQVVDISLCDGDHCQSESLDAGKPAEKIKRSGQ